MHLKTNWCIDAVFLCIEKLKFRNLKLKMLKIILKTKLKIHVANKFENEIQLLQNEKNKKFAMQNVKNKKCNNLVNE